MVSVEAKVRQLMLSIASTDDEGIRREVYDAIYGVVDAVFGKPGTDLLNLYVNAVDDEYYIPEQKVVYFVRAVNEL